MSPEQRKEASELILHKRGIRINVQLHVIESDDEVVLRTPEQLLQRLLALWAVSSVAAGGDAAHYRAYLDAHALTVSLSAQERLFLYASEIDDDMRRPFADRNESLYFLCWAAGLLDKLAVPTQTANLKQVLKLFPQEMEPPQRLEAAMKMRRKSELLDWSDLLYRLHWAVRHAHLTARAAPGNLHAVAVREWHQAVNWICQYEEEDDWDKVSTETGS